MNLANNQGEAALFLPAIQPGYAALALGRKPLGDRPFPRGLRLRDLDFLGPDSALWSTRYALYSGGVCRYATGPTIVSARGDECTIVGDSGGYQLISDPSLTSAALRQQALTWQEAECDWGMILDVPTAAVGRTRSTEEECLRETAENLEYFDQNRSPAKCRFLNVLQGNSEESSDSWYLGVRKYSTDGQCRHPLEGWAIGGKLKWNAYNTVKRLLQLKRDGLIQDKGWLHFLGAGSPAFAVIATALRDAIRDSGLNPSIQVSNDSALAFQAAYGRRSAAVGPVFSWDRFTVPFARIPDGRAHIGSTAGFPFRSPIANRLEMGHLCVEKTGFQNHWWDEVSWGLVANHNQYVLIQACIDAARISRWSDEELRARTGTINSTTQQVYIRDIMPARLYRARQQIMETFHSDQPGRILRRYRSLLRNVLREYTTADEMADES